jgi:hypothetical protein
MEMDLTKQFFCFIILLKLIYVNSQNSHTTKEILHFKK